MPAERLEGRQDRKSCVGKEYKVFGRDNHVTEQMQLRLDARRARATADCKREQVRSVLTSLSISVFSTGRTHLNGGGENATYGN